MTNDDSDEALHPYEDPELKPVIESILKKLPFRVQELEEALAKKDWELLTLLSHRLKGTLGGCGFADMARIADLIEGEAKNKANPDQILTHIRDLGRAAAKQKI